MNVTTAVEQITPEIAQQYLLSNDGNRNVRPVRVEAYATAMKRGEWEFTGEPIVFDQSGTLVNGQHRLHACVKAGVPFTTIVVRNVSSRAYDFFDSGLPRTASDVIAHAKIKNSSTVAAAAKSVLAFQAGVIHNGPSTFVLATRRAIREEIESNLGLYEEAGRLASLASSRGLLKAGFAAFYVLCVRRYGEDKANEFVGPLLSGAGLQEGDSRLALLTLVMGPNRPRAAVPLLAAMIRTWNAYARGEGRKLIRNWNPGQPFPSFDD